MMVKQSTPKLRFPEFENGWILKKYDEIYTFYSTNSLSRDKLNYENGKVKNIHYGDIHTKFPTLFDISKEMVPFINDDINISTIPSENYCQEGDLLIADASEDYDDVGKTVEIVNLNNEKVLAGLHTFLARPEKLNMASGFTGFMLQSWYVRKQVMKIAQGTKVLGLAKSRLGKINLNIPALSEQQKIASFLTAVDEKIAQLTKKKALLEQYKKGVMQQLFSQEIRFKDDDDNDYPHWQERELGKMGTFQTSSVDKLSKEDEKDVYLINYMDVYRHKDINNHTVKSFQIVTAKENQIKSSNLRMGDILFTPSSETTTDIGHSIVIFEDIDNAVYSYHLIRFRPKIKLNILFSHYFCNSSTVLRQLSRFATGSTRFTISIANFSKVLVKYPCTNEQAKIANFLSALDDKIVNVNNQIEKTTAFKKGLLQKMFV